MKSLLEFLSRQPQKPLLSKLGFGKAKKPRSIGRAATEKSLWAQFLNRLGGRPGRTLIGNQSKPEEASKPHSLSRATQEGSAWTKLLSRLSQGPRRALISGWSDSAGMLFGIGWAMALVIAIGWCLVPPGNGQSDSQAEALVTAENETAPPSDLAADATPAETAEDSPSIEAMITEESAPAPKTGEPENEPSILAAITDGVETEAKAEANVKPEPEPEPEAEAEAKAEDTAPAELASWAEQAKANQTLLEPELTKVEAALSEQPQPVEDQQLVENTADDESTTAATEAAPAIETLVDTQIPPPVAEAVEPVEELATAVKAIVPDSPEPEQPLAVPSEIEPEAPKPVVVQPTQVVKPAPIVSPTTEPKTQVAPPTVLITAENLYLQGKGSQAIQTLETALEKGNLKIDEVSQAESARRNLRQLKILYGDIQAAAKAGDVAKVQRTARLYNIAEGLAYPGKTSLYQQRIQALLSQLSVNQLP